MCVALLLAAGAPLHPIPPPSAPRPYFWPKPDVVEEIDVPDVVRADGVPVRMHVIRSKKGIQELLETFAQSFVDAGFYVARVQKRIVAEPHVTGLDWRGLVSYSAILSPNEDGTTTCILGEASLGGAKRGASGNDFAPLLPAATEVMRVDQEGARVISYVVAGTTSDAVRKFYQEQLGKAGFKASGERADVWQKAGSASELTLIAKPTGDGAVSVVLVLTRT